MASALLVLVVHQPLVALAHAVGWAPWRAWQLTPTEPFGVPALASAVWWGALWGLPMVRLARRGWVRAGVLIALGTVAVGALLLPATAARPTSTAEAGRWLVVALVINGSWAAAAARLALWIDQRRTVVSPDRAG